MGWPTPPTSTLDRVVVARLRAWTTACVAARTSMVVRRHAAAEWAERSTTWSVARRRASSGGRAPSGGGRWLDDAGRTRRATALDARPTGRTPRHVHRADGLLHVHRRPVRRRSRAVRRGDAPARPRPVDRQRGGRRRACCTRRPTAEPDLVVVLGPPTRLPPSLVWELAYGELVFVAVGWRDLGAAHLGDGDRRLRPSPPPLRRARLTSERARCAEPAVPRHGGRAAHLQARRGRPHRRAADRGARQGARRRQGRAQDDVEVRRPARADEPRAAAAVPGRELDIVSQAESVEPLAPMLVDPRPSLAGDGRARGRRPAGAGARAEPAAVPHGWSGCCARSPSAPAPLVVPAFYWKLLAAEGVRPELDACVRCGEREPDRRSWRSTSTRAACCAARAASGAPISPAALALMRDDPRRSAQRGARASRSRRPPTRSACSPPGRSSTTSSAACAPSPCSSPLTPRVRRSAVVRRCRGAEAVGARSTRVERHARCPEPHPSADGTGIGRRARRP